MKFVLLDVHVDILRLSSQIRVRVATRMFEGKLIFLSFFYLGEKIKYYT